LEIKEQVELSHEYDEARAEKLDERLSKIEKKLAKIAPVNMAKMIEIALSGCMEKMIDQLTDRVVRRFEDATQEDRNRGEIRRGKQVEATPEEQINEIEFEPGVTFSMKENEKVKRAIWA
jgi:Zn-dependent M16 (insulinase) family peptidase